MRKINPASVKTRRKVPGFFIFAVLTASLAPAGSAAAAAQAETAVSPQATPEIQQVKPTQAAAGEEVTLMIDGRNFSRGAYVSFTDPAVRVLSTRRISATQLEAKLAIGGSAAAGTTSLHVSNPASSVAETPFTIVASASPPTPAPPKPAPPTPAPPTPAAPTPAPPTPAAPTPAPAPVPAPTPTPEPTATPTAVPQTGESQQFQVYNLGDAATLFQSSNKPKGTLAFAGGKLSYQEGGKQVFSLASGDIKEIDVNTILGVNTGTFHVILNSGKTYNFVAASLLPADSQQMVESLRKALH